MRSIGTYATQDDAAKANEAARNVLVPSRGAVLSTNAIYANVKLAIEAADKMATRITKERARQTTDVFRPETAKDPLLKACVKSASESADGIIDQLALDAALTKGYSKHFITKVVVKPPVPQQPEKISTNMKRPFSELESDSVKRLRPGLGMGLMRRPQDHTCSGCYCSECDRIDNAAIDSKAAAARKAKLEADMEEYNAMLATRSQYRLTGPARGRRYLG